MELKVVIDKKFAFMIFGAILILAGAIYGYAFGGSEPGVMGHSLGELEGVQARVTGDCSAGSSIRVIAVDGTVTCEGDTDTDTDTQDLSINGNTLSLQRGGSVTLPSGSSGTLTCNIRTGPTNKVSTATCTSSYTLTGGGCQTTSFNNKDHHFYPSGNSYICQDDGQPLVAYAICCKIT